MILKLFKIRLDSSLTTVLEVLWYVVTDKLCQYLHLIINIYIQL